MTLALELAGAFLGGLAALPVSAAVWWRFLGGRRKMMQKLLGPLAGALAAAPPHQATTASGQPPKP